MWFDFGSGDLYNLDHYNRVQVNFNAPSGPVIYMRHNTNRYQDVVMRYQTKDKAEAFYHKLRKFLAPAVMEDNAEMEVDT